MASKDLSTVHKLVSDMFRWPNTVEEWDSYRLSGEQVEFFNKNGYVAGIKLLDEQQAERIKKKIGEIADPRHPGHELFYEFHSNESTDPSTILFHALRACQLSERLHDVLWNPMVVVAASEFLCNVHDL